MNKADIDRIFHELIAQYFPEIKKVRIKLRFTRKADYYMMISYVFFGYFLSIDSESLKFSEPAFKGCLAHELAHIYWLQQLSFFKRIKEGLKKDDPADERDADRLVIERGLGKELLQFHKEHNKEYTRYDKSDGLTTNEVRKLLRKK